MLNLLSTIFRANLCGFDTIMFINKVSLVMFSNFFRLFLDSVKRWGLCAIKIYITLDLHNTSQIASHDCQ